MIELKGITKKYKSNNFVALNDINLKLPSKGFVAICGENGCGKTTLLNIIATNDTDYVGDLFYDDYDYKKNLLFLRKDILSYIYQENHNISFLNVEDNLRLDNNELEVNNELEKYDISTKKKELFSNLSGDQKQRVSFIRGILKKSKVLIVDEPTSSLSEEMEEQIFKELYTLSRNKLVILVSHNLFLVRKNCDVIYHMDKARIIKEELLHSKQIEYSNEQIDIPTSNYGMMDKNKVNEIIGENNQLNIKVDESNNEVNKLDYSKDFSNAGYKKNNILFKESFKILKKMYFKNIKNVVLPLFINVIFIALLYMLISLQTFNTRNFTYEALKDYDYVHFNRSYSDYNNKINYEYLINELDTKAVVVNKINNSINLDIEVLEGHFMPSLKSTAFTKANSVNLIYGEFPTSSIPMITDFTADTIIKYSSDYNNYDDLIQNGYRDDTIEFPIAGIIDTDYEIYLDKNGLMFDENLYDIFEDKVFNEYALLYYSFDYVNKSSKLENFFISEFDQFINIEIDDSVLKNECIISANLANDYDLDIGKYLKLNIGYFEVSNINTLNADTIKLSLETYNKFKNKLLFDVENVNVKINKIETLKYFEQHNYEHRSPISDDITRIVHVINLLTNVFLIMFIILYFIITIAYLLIENSFLNKLSNYIAFKKANGFRKKDLYPTIIINSIFHFIINLIISFIITFTLTNVYNNYISNLFDKKIIFFNNNYVFFIGIILLLTITSSLISYITFHKLYKKDICELLKK